jgi:glycosyltransferase involved in cell wall biosynthesis
MMPDTPEQPLITFAIFAYNQERFIAEAVQGAFDQTYFPLEIILSDDCSPDGTFVVMQEMADRYKGPHRLIVRCNQCNLGIGEHVNRVMELAQGELIIAAAGDDVSLPSRTARVWQEYRTSAGKAYSIFSNEYLTDEFGKTMALDFQKPPEAETLTLDWFTHRQSSVTGSSHAWHREVFDIFGPLGDGVVSEDTAIPFRSLLLGSIRYIHEPLVLRRSTGGNLSLGSLHWWDPHASVARFRAKELRHAKNYVAICETRLSDIDRLGQRQPERQDELDTIRAVTAKMLSRVQAEVKFWEASDRGKYQILYCDFLKNGFVKTSMRLFLSCTFPSLYLRWRHFAWFRQMGKLPQVQPAERQVS